MIRDGNIAVEKVKKGSCVSLILGLVFGILGVLLLLLLIFLLRRKWKKARYENDPFGGDREALPTAIPIKNFSAHYDDLKQHINKLKQEFSLLETRSAENSLPVTVALLEDNKKKNRYINILPCK